MKNNYEQLVRSLLTEFNDDLGYKSRVSEEQQNFYEKRLHATNIYLAAKNKKEKIQHENKKREIEFEVIRRVIFYSLLL